MDVKTKTTVITVIKKHWDCFVKVGDKQTVLEYEVGIVTGGANPVCCLKLSYGPYETKIIVQQVAQLLCNEWIEQCEGP